MLLYQSRQRQAGVAELADALDSGSSGSNLVEVQVLSPAFFKQSSYGWLLFLLVRKQEQASGVIDGNSKEIQKIF